MVHTWSGPFTANTTVSRTDIGSASTTYSYAVCIKNSGGTVIRSYQAKNITSSIAKHTAFLMSTAHVPGSLGGLSGADAQYQARANAAGFSGTYKAMLSSSAIDVKNRLTIAAPIYNRANELVATNATDLCDGTLAAPIAYTENGVYTN